MTEPRYHPSLTDPEETAPISTDALETMRESSAQRGVEVAPDGADRQAGSNGHPARDTNRDGAAPAGGNPVGRRHDDRGREAAFAARYLDTDSAYGPDEEDRSPRHGANGRGSYPSEGYSALAERDAGQRSSSRAHSRDRDDGEPVGPGDPGYRRFGELPPPTRPASPAAGHGSTLSTGRDEAPAPSPVGYGGAPYSARPGYPGDSSAGPQLGGPGFSPLSGPGGGVGAPPMAGLSGPAYPGMGGAGGMAAGQFVGGPTVAPPRVPRSAGRPRTDSRPRPARRARLLVRHIDPWSTMKFALVMSVALFFVWLVAIGLLYGVLDGMGVFNKINGLYDEVSGSTGDKIVTPSMVLGSATLIGAINIVLMTALATVGAFVYNICSDLVGGVEVTLAERD